jgi:hypothetical protein
MFSLFYKGLAERRLQVFVVCQRAILPFQEIIMRSYLKTIGIVAAAAVTLAVTPLVTSGSASARPFGFHGGFHHGWGHRGFGFGPALAGGLAFGALAAAPYSYSRPVGLYGDCVLERRIVGRTYWGRPISRPVRVCY